jgi:two-component system chemotaxis response regulator CheY
MLRLRLGATIVGEGSDGEQAIDLAVATQPDVLVLDHVMPVLLGGDAVADIRAASPNTCIIMFSATMLYAVDLGDGGHLPDRFVSKSDGLEGLLQAVGDCLAERQAAAADDSSPSER